MKKTFKKLLATMLAIVMVLSVAPLAAFAQQAQGDSNVSLQKDGLNVESTNTIGDILSQSIENQNEESNSSYGIVSAKTKDKYVEVEFVNEQACTLIAALYDDDSGKMLTYALKNVEADEREATLTFDIANMPEYYLVRVFLIGAEKEALCDDYSYIEKTHNFVEAQAKTVDDFAGEIIINFDEDKTNNFAVVAEDGVEISSKNGYNILSGVDEENGIYTFTNINESISTLTAGQVLTYGDSAENMLVLKIAKIEINGSTATVWAKRDAQIGELFDFVKMDLQSDGSAEEKTVDTTGMEDGITYEGMEEYNADDVQPMSLVDKEYTDKMYCPVWKINKKIGNDGELSGTYVEFKFEIKVGVTYMLKMYYDVEWEWKWDFWNSYSDYYFFESTFEFFATGSGSVTGVLRKDFYMGAISFVTPVGITLGVGFRLAFSASAGISLEAIKITFKLGVRYDEGKGFSNLSSTPEIEFVPSLATMVEVSVGIKASPNIGWMKLLELSIAPEFGFKAEATVFDVDIIGEITGKEKDEKHDCKLCFDGVIKFYVKATLAGEIFGKDVASFKLIEEISWELWDFYWSVTYDEFEFNQECPHKSYLITFNITDSDGNALGNASVSVSGNTVKSDNNGKAKIYLAKGNHSATITCNGYKSSAVGVLVSGKAENVNVKLYKSTEAPDPSNPTNPTDPTDPTDPDNPSGNLGGIGSDDTTLTGNETVGTIINFGSYPQTKVTDTGIISQLNAKAGDNKNWTSYNYYSGTGSSSDGQMTASDYMRYTDVVLGSNKYRGVIFDSYRPYCTGYTSSSTYQDDNGYSTGTVYWFKYEPIKWRVLDPTTGLVMSETILDSQAYNNYIVKNGDEYYGDEQLKYTDADGNEKDWFANNYEKSSIREWLNKDFYNTAFSASQKNMIATTTLDNSAYSTSYSKYDSATTKDKIYLLSYADALNTSYGFSSSYSEYDIDRRAQGSDYAKSQGLYVSTSSSYSGNSYWRLRSAGCDSSITCNVLHGGYVSSYCNTNDADDGVRPALNLNLTSVISQSSRAAAKVAVYAPIATLSITTSTAAVLDNGTFTVSGAVNGNRYMVYGIKNYVDGTEITASNLVYVNQTEAENGKAVFEYKPSSTSTATVVVVGDFGGGIEEAVITLQDKPNPSLAFVSPSTTTISYGDSIVLHANAENMPSGGKIVWEASNGNFSYGVSSDGTTCTITPKSSGDTIFTAKIVDKDGNVVSSDTQKMTSKAGLWQKIVAFFKNLFGANKVIPYIAKALSL